MEASVTPSPSPSPSSSPAGRNSNVVYQLPHRLDSVAAFLRGPLEKIDPAEAAVQLLILTTDAETTLALSDAVLAMTGLGGIELFPVTRASRARRVLSMRPIHAIAGPPEEIRALIESTHLKLETLKIVVIAWADDILKSPKENVAALEAIMTEIPKDAARVLVATEFPAEVEQLVERYLRRARRAELVDAAGNAAVTTGVIQTVTVSFASRPSVLRRLLDEIDPPSAVVIARVPASELEVRQILRRLGYSRKTDPVQISTGEVPANTHAVIFYDPPGAADIAAAFAAGPVQTIALVQPRELAELRRIAPTAAPLVPKEAISRARSGDARLREELKAVVEEGSISREVIALEPLLDELDPVDLAAAAVKLLERARADRPIKPAATAPVSAGAPPAVERGMTKLFITIGEQDGIRAGDLVGAIAGETGLPGAAIGKIDIRDKHSLVEVESANAEQVISKMNGSQIRGRKVVVRAERERPPREGGRGERERPSRDGGRGERPRGGDRSAPRKSAGSFGPRNRSRE